MSRSAAERSSPASAPDDAPMDDAPTDDVAAAPSPPTWGAALRAWGSVAINSFGGPAGQIAVMHRTLVDERRWISEQRFLHALNYCMLLPGPEAQQLSVYIGWLLHGIRGGLAAGLLFIAPGFVAILALSILYAGFGQTEVVSALFYGLKPAILAIVAAAVVRVASRALITRALMSIAGAAFLAIYVVRIPYPAVILVAALAGWWLGRTGRVPTRGAGGHGAGAAGHGAGAGASRPDTGASAILADHHAAERPEARRALLVLAAGLLLWLAPVLGLVALFGTSDLYASQALFFSGAAVVTFGGAYAVLTYVAQQVVQSFGWLTPAQMLDGLALAETTPGPLIMVVEFVGFLAAYQRPGTLDPMAAGLLGAVLVTWVTFVPSFLWVLAGAPYAEYLRGNRALTGALSGITAAVVGAILNLGVWFTVHVLFQTVDEVRVGPLVVSMPVPSSLDVAALVIAAASCVAVFRFRVPTLRVLLVAGLAGAAWYLLRP